MTAKVKEVSAYQAIDGEVFDTYIKAHHRNIWVLLGRLLGDMESYDFQDGQHIHQYLQSRLIDTFQSRNLVAKNAIIDLAEELK